MSDSVAVHLLTIQCCLKTKRNRQTVVLAEVNFPKEMSREKENRERKSADGNIEKEESRIEFPLLFTKPIAELEKNHG